MRSTLLHVVIIALMALLPLPGAQAQTLARIYVYEQPESPSGSWFRISCDGTIVAKLKRGRFFAINVAPGRHMLRDEKGVPVSVDARSSKDTFVRFNWHIEIGVPAIPVLEVVPPGEAHQKMTFLTYIDAGKVLSRSVPKCDPRKITKPRLKRQTDTDRE